MAGLYELRQSLLLSMVLNRYSVFSTLPSFQMTTLNLANYASSLWDIVQATASRQVTFYHGIDDPWPAIRVDLGIRRVSWLDRKIVVLPLICEQNSLRSGLFSFWSTNFDPHFQMPCIGRCIFSSHFSCSPSSLSLTQLKWMTN